MSDAPSIPRRPRDPAETDFDGLRAAGIRLLEELTGERWTDYNLHDPGITILEQLCFGLTDLVYRVDFDVEDHLTGPDGAIDFTGQALHLPQDILPCRPTTAEDYRRTILDCEHEVDDAWIHPWPWPGHRELTASGGPGLYYVVLRPAEGADPDDPEVAARVQARLSGARNLGEDVAAVVVARPVHYELVADIDVTGARPLTDILTDVYRTAEAYVAGRPEPEDAAEALGRGDATLDEIFDGPTGCGARPLVDAGDYSPENLFIADIVARVQRIEGIVGVRSLYLSRPAWSGGEGGAGPRREASTVTDVLPRYSLDTAGDTPTWTVPALRLPRGRSEAGTGEARGGEGSGGGVRLWRRGQPLAEPAGFAAQYRSMLGSHRLERARRVAPGAFHTPPAGEHRALGKYRSIQRHFPGLYGINEHGVHASAPEEVRLSAYRLKSYLLLFEQVMGNFVAGLDHLRDLYSVKGGPGAGSPWAPTYPFLPLGAEEIPGFEGTYDGDSGSPEAPGKGYGPYFVDPSVLLPRAIAPQDDVLDRRSRLQDHLLAVFGESLAPRTRKGPDGEGALDDEPLPWVVGCRARLLEDIPAATRDRGGAMDFLNPGKNPVSGFKRRVALLLGMSPTTRFHVLEHVLLRPASERLSEEAWRSFYGLQASVFFPGWAGRAVDAGFRQRAEDLVARSCPAHVRARCYWLSEERMQEFEELERTWRAQRTSWLQRRVRAGTGRSSPAEDLDGAAASLVRFVWAERRGHGR